MNAKVIRQLVVFGLAVAAVGLGIRHFNEQEKELAAKDKVVARETAVVDVLKTQFGPLNPYEDYDTPESPDYSNRSYWAALPDMEDPADTVPTGTGVSNTQATAEVDVFYVHPTTAANKAEGWTASAKEELKFGPFDPLALQASVFNGDARIYAPRYRQATLFSFFDDSGEGKKAIAFAQSDVIRAFIHYLAHYNKGRPFFIAGHSQGSKLLVPVLQYLEKYPSDKFIAAYVPGWSISASDFETMKPCNSPVELGCFNVWNAKAWGAELEEFVTPARYIGSDCVNPLSWKNDEVEVENDKHLGSIDILGTKLDKNYVKAKCHGEMLWVDLPDDPFYQSKMNKKLFHIVDYGLFYLNIRENIRERIAAFNTGQKLSSSEE